MTATTAARIETAAKPRTSSLRHSIHFTVQSVLLTLRDWSFLAFVIAIPTAMYLFFVGIYGDQIDSGSGVTVAATMMVTMATYGGLGAAMTAGAQIQSERATGWFRQLMLTSLTPTQFMVAKAVVSVVIIFPAIAAVFISGAIRGLRMPLEQWLTSGGLIVASLLPMVLLGLSLGLWFKQAAASAAVTLSVLVLSMIGGLWFPLDMMPDAMAAVGRLLPSHWAGQIGIWGISGGEFPWQGVVVIGAWTVSLTVIGMVGYRRAVRSSRR